MSIMRCSKCETMVDTDVDNYDFVADLCENCWYNMTEPEYTEHLIKTKPKFSLIRLLKSLWAGIWATFK